MSPELALLSGQIQDVLEELLTVARLKKGQILVVGCSTSEVLGAQIGSAGSTEVAEILMAKILERATDAHVAVAIQCCEHLNRALVTERAVMEAYGLTEVTVHPIPKAGGALAAKAMELFADPVVVESIQAHAGIDIGLTLIGMHLRPVAIPIRLQNSTVGQARVVAASTRPKLIGGSRAVYQ